MMAVRTVGMAFWHKTDDTGYSSIKIIVEQIQINGAHFIKRNIADAVFVLIYMALSLYLVHINPDYKACDLSTFQSWNLVWVYTVNLVCIFRYCFGYSIKQARMVSDLKKSGTFNIVLIPLYRYFQNFNVFFIAFAITAPVLYGIGWHAVAERLTCFVIVGAAINGLLEVFLNTFNVKPYVGNVIN